MQLLFELEKTASGEESATRVFYCDPSEMTVAVGLYNMTADTAAMLQNFTTFAAGSILIAIPIVILYISLQRFMIEGISSGAVKG